MCASVYSFLKYCVCACVYACVYARARACVCVCARGRSCIGKRKLTDACGVTAAPHYRWWRVTANRRVCLHDSAVCPEQRAVSDGKSLLRAAHVSTESALL